MDLEVEEVVERGAEEVAEPAGVEEVVETDGQFEMQHASNAYIVQSDVTTAQQYHTLEPVVSVPGQAGSYDASEQTQQVCLISIRLVKRFLINVRVNKLGFATVTGAPDY